MQDYTSIILEGIVHEFLFNGFMAFLTNKYGKNIPLDKVQLELDFSTYLWDFMHGPRPQ